MDNFFSVIFWFGFLCCMPVLAVGAPVGFVLVRNKQRTEGSQAIARVLGLQPTVKAKQMQWYEGRLANGHFDTAQCGRLIAYLPIIFKRHYNDHEGRRRGSHVSAARLIVEVKRERPLDADIFRHEQWSKKKRPYDSFATAFVSKNGEKLTNSQQAGLLHFVQQNPGSTVWLRDRAEASQAVFTTPEVMAQATTFLLHEYAVVNPSPEEIQQKTAELSQLASLFDE